MIGGLLVSTTLFADAPGLALVYDRALRLERWVWITPACSKASPRPTEVLKQLVARAKRESQGARARWHLINQAEFAERAARVRARNENRGTSELVALVSAGEVLPAVQQRHAQTLTRFASRCKRLRLSEGLAGVASDSGQTPIHCHVFSRSQPTDWSCWSSTPMSRPELGVVLMDFN